MNDLRAQSGPTCHNLRKILEKKFQEKATYDILRVIAVIYLFKVSLEFGLTLFSDHYSQ